jgi:hypothetical protein
MSAALTANDATKALRMGIMVGALPPDACVCIRWWRGHEPGGWSRSTVATVLTGRQAAVAVGHRRDVNAYEFDPDLYSGLDRFRVAEARRSLRRRLEGE